MRPFRASVSISSLASFVVFAAVCGAIATIAAFQTSISRAAFTASTDSASNSASVDTLDAPTGLAVATPNPQSRSLTWTSTPDTYASGYEIFRSTTSGSGYTSIGTVSGHGTTSFLDDTICPTVTGPKYVSKSVTRTASTTSYPFDHPEFTTEGDFLIAQITTENGRTVDTYTPPAGWTQLAQVSSSNQVGVAVFYKFVGSSEPATHTFTIDFPRYMAGVMYAYRGVDPTTPIDVSATNTGGGQDAVAPSVTTTTDDALVLRFFSNDHNVPSYRPYPNDGSTPRYSMTADYNGSWMAELPAGTAGVVPSVTTHSHFAEEWAAIVVALRSADFYECPGIKWAATELHTIRYNVPSTNIAVPDNTAVGDLLIAFLAIDNQSTITPPAGWTTIDSAYISGGTDTYGIYYRIADATDVTGSGNPGQVTFYRDTFSGSSWSTGPTYEDHLSYTSVGNDAVSSIEIPTGLRVRACEHSELQGTCNYYTSDVDLASTFNDKITSVEVTELPAYEWISSADQQIIGTMIRITGADTTNPIEANTIATGTSSSADAPSVTTTTDGAMILRLIATDQNGFYGWAQVAGHDRMYVQDAESVESSVSYTIQDTAGATGTASFPTGASTQWGATTIAVKPAAASSNTFYYVVQSVAGNWQSTNSSEAS